MKKIIIVTLLILLTSINTNVSAKQKDVLSNEEYTYYQTFYNEGTKVKTQKVDKQTYEKGLKIKEEKNKVKEKTLKKLDSNEELTEVESDMVLQSFATFAVEDEFGNLHLPLTFEECYTTDNMCDGYARFDDIGYNITITYVEFYPNVVNTGDDKVGYIRQTVMWDGGFPTKISPFGPDGDDFLSISYDSARFQVLSETIYTEVSETYLYEDWKYFIICYKDSSEYININYQHNPSQNSYNFDINPDGVTYKYSPLQQQDDGCHGFSATDSIKLTYVQIVLHADITLKDTGSIYSLNYANTTVTGDYTHSVSSLQFSTSFGLEIKAGPPSIGLSISPTIIDEFDHKRESEVRVNFNNYPEPSPC